MIFKPGCEVRLTSKPTDSSGKPTKANVECGDIGIVEEAEDAWGDVLVIFNGGERDEIALFIDPDCLDFV